MQDKNKDIKQERKTGKKFVGKNEIDTVDRPELLAEEIVFHIFQGSLQGVMAGPDTI